MKEKELMELAAQIRSISQTGKVYAESEYDNERYDELLKISHKLTAIISGTTFDEVNCIIPLEIDYVTPKVDIRAVVFNESGELLMVKERADGLWSLPGGWADVGYTPSEVAVKEVLEETGLCVTPVRLLAVHDKKCHDHPPAMHYAYKIFIQCELTGGELRPAFDTLDCGFFAFCDVPELSVERVTNEQIQMVFDYRSNTSRPAEVD